MDWNSKMIIGGKPSALLPIQQIEDTNRSRHVTFNRCECQRWWVNMSLLAASLNSTDEQSSGINNQCRSGARTRSRPRWRQQPRWRETFIFHLVVSWLGKTRDSSWSGSERRSLQVPPQTRSDAGCISCRSDQPVYKAVGRLSGERGRGSCGLDQGF